MGRVELDAPEDLWAAARELPAGLIARGRIRANPSRCEVQVVDVSGAPRVVRKGWLALGHFDDLTELVDCRVGSVETQQLRAWWTRDGAPFVLWDEAGRWWWQEGDALVCRDGQRVVAGGVEAYVGEDWVEQGVRVAGGPVIAAVQNTSVKNAFPGYDGIDLDWDTSWCRVLGMAIGEAMGWAYENRT